MVQLATDVQEGLVVGVVALERLLVLLLDLQESIDIHAGGFSRGGHAVESVVLDLLQLVLHLLDMGYHGLEEGGESGSGQLLFVLVDHLLQGGQVVLLDQGQLSVE